MKKVFIFLTVFAFFSAYSSRKRKADSDSLIIIDSESSERKQNVLAEYLAENDVIEELDSMFGTDHNPIAWALTEEQFDEAEDTLRRKIDRKKRMGNKVIDIRSSDNDKLILLQYLMLHDPSQIPTHLFGTRERRVSWTLPKKEFEDTRDFLNQKSDEEGDEQHNEDIKNHTEE